MLAWRLSLGPILIAALIGIFYLDARSGPTAVYLLVFSLLLAVRGAWELGKLLQTRNFAPNTWLAIGGTCLIVAANWWPQFRPSTSTDTLGVLGLPMILLALSVLALFVSGAVRFREPGQSMEALGAELLIICYIGVLLSLTAQLRWVAGAELGYVALGSLVICTKSGDILAYTLGRLFGKRKMVPLLSPGKTWMGGLGALLGAALGGWAWFHWGLPAASGGQLSCPPQWAILYGVVLGLTGLVGDLCESLIKRDVGKKDSAPLLPGFGGLLDLLDSVIFSGPVAYLMWLVLPLTGG